MQNLKMHNSFRRLLDPKSIICRARRRRWHGPMYPIAMACILVGFVIISLTVEQYKQNLETPGNAVQTQRLRRSLLQETTEADEELGDEGNETISSNETVSKKGDPLFPPELFTVYQLRRGAILLHCLGMVYMFVALAMVCDEFFVPALDVIIEKLEISEDVAGATFMAAGGSAPELFTSVIGVFISFNDVGIGTIVGSAVFNILFVIAMCVLFSRTVLELTWWPLFRDVTFYSVALLMLVYFFTDSRIYWYEAAFMFLIYLLYCSFMKVNGTVEGFVKRLLNKNKVTRVCSTDELVPNNGAAQPGAPGSGTVPGAMGALPGPGLPGLALAGGSGMRRPSMAAPVMHSGSKFRHGLLQLMIHTIDPLHDGKVDEKATQLHAIASLKVLLDATKPQNGRVQTYRSDGTPNPPGAPGDLQSQGTEVTHIDSLASSDVASSGMHHPNGDLMAQSESNSNNVSHGGRRRGPQNNGLSSNIPPIPEDASESPPMTPLASPGVLNGMQKDGYGPITYTASPPGSVPSAFSHKRDSGIKGDDGPMGEPPLSSTTRDSWMYEDDIEMDMEEDDENKPIDLSWPSGWRKRLTYIFVAPLIFPLWITLPDTRTPRGKRFFIVTFFGSIMWIAVFSYLMVWWASTVGDTIKIPPPVMGLTILAAGTSVPDLITSVIVARKGFGDMAVSSSVGSNLFDVCVGLPVPWLIKALIDVIKNHLNELPDPWQPPPIVVESDGLACSVMLLFSMLMFVIISIAVSNWKMSKGLGVFMFFLYFVFVVVSLALHEKYIPCDFLEGG